MGLSSSLAFLIFEDLKVLFVEEMKGKTIELFNCQRK